MLENIEINKYDWRTRVIIVAPVLFKDEIYNFINAGIRILPLKKNRIDGVYIIEAYVLRKLFPKIEDAFFYSMERIAEFTDQVSLISLKPVLYRKILSTCPMEVEKNEEFEMLIPSDLQVYSNPPSISNDDLKYYYDIIDNKNYIEAIREVRRGISTRSFEEKAHFYFSALERIAELKTKDKISITCPNCDFKVERGPATSNYLIEQVQKYGMDKKTYLELRKVRSKIAHGSGKRDFKFTKRIRELMPQFEGVVLSFISDHCNIKLKSAVNIQTSIPYWIHKGEKITNRFWFIPARFKLRSSSFVFPMSFSKVDSSLTKPNENDFGLLGPNPEEFEKPAIHREAWPY